MKKTILLLIIFIMLLPNIVQATQTSIDTDAILESQQDSLDINSFIEEADKYTENVYEDIDMGELFSSAITGDIDNETIIKSILKAIRWRSIRCHNCSCKYFSYNCNS